MTDRDYRIKGIGLVVSGFNGGPPLSVGEKILINNTHEGVIRSVHNDFRESIQTLPSGVRGCLAIRTVLDRVPIGSVLSVGPIVLTKRFQAQVEIFSNNSITIKPGYQTDIHCGTIRRTCRVVNPEEVVFRGGDKGVISFEVMKPAYLEENQTFFFREGLLIGEGRITNVA